MDSQPDIQSHVYGLPQADVLNNSDILGLIFGHLDVIDMSKMDLLQAALTCKAFFNPALDSLWRAVHSLIPLLKLLRPFKLTDNKYTLYGPIEDDNWKRFEFYARRVRAYIHRPHPDGMPTISDSVYLRLAQLRTSPLLPNLHQLQAESVDALQSQLLFFITPSLRSVCLKDLPNGEQHYLETFLAALPSEVPSLTQLCLHGQIPSHTQSYLTFNNSLRVLDLSGSIEPPVFGRMRCLEGLVDLAVDVPYHCAIPAFPVLERLMIKGDLIDIESSLQALGHPPLSHIVVTIQSQLKRRVIDAVKCAELVRYLTSKWSKTLKSISLEIHIRIRFPLEPQLLLFASFGTTRDLRFLGLEDMTPFGDISDDALKGLASGLPKIEVLHLPYNTTGSSINALSWFATSCPHLKVLGISIQYLNVIGDSCSDHSLQTLSVDSGPVYSQPKIAKYLDDLFPRLNLVQRRRPDDGRNGDWQQVDSLVKMCQGVRSTAMKRMNR